MSSDSFLPNSIRLTTFSLNRHTRRQLLFSFSSSAPSRHIFLLLWLSDASASLSASSQRVKQSTPSRPALEKQQPRKLLHVQQQTSRGADTARTGPAKLLCRVPCFAAPCLSLRCFFLSRLSTEFARPTPSDNASLLSTVCVRRTPFSSSPSPLLTNSTLQSSSSSPFHLPRHVRLSRRLPLSPPRPLRLDHSRHSPVDHLHLPSPVRSRRRS